MSSFTVVVGHPLYQDPLQVPLVERNAIVETLATCRPDQSLAECVRLRHADRCLFGRELADQPVGVGVCCATPMAPAAAAMTMPALSLDMNVVMAITTIEV